MAQPESSAARWRRRYDLLTALLILAVLAAQIWFAHADLRLPRDPGLYYKLVPELYHALGAPIAERATILEALASSTGWYNLLLAAGMKLFGRGPEVFELACATWVGLLLLGCALLARRSSGPLAAFCAVALAAAMPSVLIIGRTPWIHIPETALASLVLVAWQRDRALERWRTVAAMALGGVLVITLRHSGVVWIAPLAPLLLWTGGKPRAWGRIAMVGAAWALGMVVPILEFSAYLQAKMGARDRYASQLPEFLEQLVANLSWPTLLACGLGLLLLLLRTPRVPNDPLRPLLLVWVLLGGLMWSLFRAGLDNFTPMMAALAVLGGLGLARIGAWGILPALFSFVITSLPQWVDKDAVVIFHSVPGFPDFTAGVHPNNHYRPWKGFAHPQVRELLAASCPRREDATCWIAVDQGLFSPFTEDPGRLELFLMGEERVQLLSLRDLEALPRIAKLHGMATYFCPERDEDWRERYPQSQTLFKQIMDGFEMEAVWSTDLFMGCSYLWMAPGGELLHSEDLPESSSPATPGPAEAEGRVSPGVPEELEAAP
jgi:hypothetical protein